MAITPKTIKNESLIRVLSNVAVIDSGAFAKAAPAQQTVLLTSTAGKPVLFVESFSTLNNRKTLRDELLAGKDVSMRLEFNGIELTSEDKATMAAVMPILAKIEALKSTYPWLVGENHEPEYPITFGGLSMIRRSYKITVSSAKNIWDRVSPYWAGLRTRAPMENYNLTENEGNKRTSYSKTHVSIGCQTIRRADVEYIAKHYGWDLPE